MEKEIEVETYFGKKKETLNTHKDTLLGDRDIRVNYHHVVSYKIYAHISKDAEIYYVYYFVAKNGQIAEYVKRIKKETAIVILSRLLNINEDKINELIPYFKTEKEKIQLHDRINDYRHVLTDDEIIKNLNKVQYFHFFGHHIECDRAYPHIPHIVGYYDTVRYGKLPIYCLGRGGALILKNGKKVQLLITKSCSEDCWGSYIFFELLE